MMFFLPRQAARPADTPAPGAVPGAVPPAAARAAALEAEPEATRSAAPPAAVLVQRLIGGDAAALGELYRREAGAVYRYVLALAGNAAWAADATQEAFVAIATRPERYDPARGPIGAYLAGAARHALAAHWRGLRRLEPLAEFDGDGADGAGPATDIADERPTPEAALARAEDVQALWRALRALPAPFREAVVLVDLQERAYTEAAAIAGVELNTLRTRLHRGRARLAALLGCNALQAERQREGR
jgi:RNA polymerase sigma-70 factor (ECF subfamily)